MPPPGCRARSQLSPQPCSPSEPGYPHLSTPPRNLLHQPLSQSGRTPGTTTLFPGHTLLLRSGALWVDPGGAKRSARLSGVAGLSRVSELSSPTRVAALNHLPTTPETASPITLGLPKTHMFPVCRPPRAEPEHEQDAPLCQVETRRSLAPCRGGQEGSLRH